MSAPPWFEDLQVGTVFDAAPALTLTEGHAALHQAIAGDRLRLALDRTLGEAVLGAGPPLAHPALVWDVAIGQSTVATGRVIANLFYRGLLLRRPVRLGDTLRTTTEVVARRENRVKEGAADRAGACCGSAPSTRRTGRCSTSRAARCCRCAASRPASRATRSAAPRTSTHEPLAAAAAGLDLAAYRAARARAALRRGAGRLGRRASRAATSSTPRRRSRG